jgi:hypothetical protein
MGDETEDRNRPSLERIYSNIFGFGTKDLLSRLAQISFYFNDHLTALALDRPIWEGQQTLL